MNGTDYKPNDPEAFLRDGDILLPAKHPIYLHRSYRGSVRILGGMSVSRLTTRHSILSSIGSDVWVADTAPNRQEAALLADAWIPNGDLPTVPKGGKACAAPIRCTALLSLRMPMHLFGYKRGHRADN